MTQTTFRLTDDEHKQIKRAAYQLGMTQQDILKRALTKWLEAVEPVIKAREMAGN